MDQTVTPAAVADNPTADSADVAKNKTMAILAYTLFFLPLITDAKDSKFAKFHANQGLILLIFAVGVSVVLSVLFPILWFIEALVWPLVDLFILVLWVLGMVNAANGKMARLPLIGNFDLIK